MGIVSCLGNDADSRVRVAARMRPGIRFIPEYAELGLRSQVAGVPQIDLEAQIDRKLKRFMGDAAAYGYIAMRDAIADAGLTDDAGARSAHRPDRRLRRRLGAVADRNRRPAAQPWRAQGRPVHGAAHDVLDRVGGAGHRVRHPRRELFDFRRLRDVGALHRRGRRHDPARHAGRGASPAAARKRTGA